MLPRFFGVVAREATLLVLAILAIAVAGCSPSVTGDGTGTTVTETTEATETTGPDPATTSPTSTTTQPEPSTTVERKTMAVLVFHKTEGFRHESIEAGIAALEQLAADGEYEMTATDDASIFTPEGLEPFGVIVFLNTTGDVLDETQQVSMEDFIASGAGFVGIHSAADTEYDWSWYGDLVGAYFEDHPAPQEATVSFPDPPAHPVTRGLPPEEVRFDEWYNFRSQPPSDATILALLDESTYDGGTMGESHPITWSREVHGGRAVYTGFGHTSESFDEPLMRTLLDQAIRWAGAARGG